MVRRHVWEPDKDGLPYMEILKEWLKDSTFYQATQNGARTAIVVARQSKTHILKSVDSDFTI